MKSMNSIKIDYNRPIARRKVNNIRDSRTRTILKDLIWDLMEGNHPTEQSFLEDERKMNERIVRWGLIPGFGYSEVDPKRVRVSLIDRDFLASFEKQEYSLTIFAAYLEGED